VTSKQIIEILKKKADPEKVLFKEKKYGIISNNALGIYHQELKVLLKQFPKNDQLAIALFESNIYEARLLCSKMYDPQNLTEKLMDHWTSTFENWEICDSFCMGLFAKSTHAVPKAIEWTGRTKTFEKRAGFTVIAAYCMADKTALNETFEQFLPIIKSSCTDERIYVKKAVNWALRNIGKRNIDLNRKAIKLSREIIKLDHKTAKWIGNNALKELTSKGVRMSDYPRSIYRK